MEQTIAFVLGVFVVLALAGVASMFKTRGQIKDLYAEIEDLQNLINELDRDINRDSEMLDRRIDQEIDRVDKSNEDLYKYIDSRTDKMADSISKHIAEIHAKLEENTSFTNLTQKAIDKLQHQLAELQVVVENQSTPF